MSALVALSYLNSYSLLSSLYIISKFNANFPSLRNHEISLENQSYLAVLCQDSSPLSIRALFPALCYPLPARAIRGSTVGYSLNTFDLAKTSSVNIIIKFCPPTKPRTRTSRLVLVNLLVISSRIRNLVLINIYSLVLCPNMARRSHYYMYYSVSSGSSFCSVSYI